MTRTFALLLLTAVGGVACHSQSDLLTPRDGGGGDSGAGVAGAGGSGGDAGSAGGGAAGVAGRGGGGGGGTGGGGSGGTGGAMQPLSTGTFPYAGRWWGRLTAPDRAGAFVIHWSADDPVDRGLWTSKHTYPLDAMPGPENGVTLRSAAPEMQGCWTLYATADPDELRVQPCDTPPSSGQAALGFFRRGARLIIPIPLPPVVGPPPVRKVVTVCGFAGGGQSIAVAVDDGVNDRLWLWRNDLGRTFDLLGPGYPSVDYSPDGQRVVYWRATPNPSDSYIEQVGYDTATGTARLVTSTGGLPGLFSPDGRRFVFYDRVNVVSAELAVYDFDTDRTLTLAREVSLEDLSANTVFLGGSRALAYRTRAPTSTAPPPLYVYDFLTGTTGSIGAVPELTAIPGGAFAAFRTDGGPAMVIDAASLTPRALPGSSIAAAFYGGGYAGFQPTPDGKRLAYVDGDHVFHLVALDGSAELTLPGMSGCLPDYSENQWPLESNLPNPPRAAKFTSDGRAIVRGIGAGCYPGPGVHTLARYDLTTGQETVQPLPELGSLGALSPLGQAVVHVGLPPLRLWSPPTALFTLAFPDPASMVPPAGPVTFSFTDDGRYLTYTVGYLMVRDIAASTTRQIAAISFGGVVAISQVTGISVVWVHDFVTGGALTALMPDGSPSVMLNPSPYGPVMTEPRGTAVAFRISDEAGDGTVLYRLQRGATPQLVGSGEPLGVSATQVIFRDLDGVCSYSWVRP